MGRQQWPNHEGSPGENQLNVFKVKNPVSPSGTIEKREDKSAEKVISTSKDVSEGKNVDLPVKVCMLRSASTFTIPILIGEHQVEAKSTLQQK